MLNPELGDGLTFDDVLLTPGYSAVLPRDVQVKTRLTRNIDLNIPILASAMDTVTEAKLAIAIAQFGGIGVIHKNLTVARQAAEVSKVKRFAHVIISDPLTVTSDMYIRQVQSLSEERGISCFPVVDEGKLSGLLTNRDLRAYASRPETLVRDAMTKDLITGEPGISSADAEARMHENRIERLPIVNDAGELLGLITIRDVDKRRRRPHAVTDEQGRLRAAAAIGVGADREERTQALIDAGVDIIVVDSAHGHSEGVLTAVRDTKREYPNVEVIAGNVATVAGTEALIEAGADAVKVGIGPGSICTTRIVAGVGVPQLTAVSQSVRLAMKHDVPIISDGGVKYSGDVVKALAAGASTVMIGSLFAGVEESPGEIILYQGRAFKSYRGMGSIGAMKEGSADRYSQEGEAAPKLVPEGIEGRVPYKGPIEDTLNQLLGGLRSGMGYVGAANLEELREKSNFVKISPAGLKESHVHDVIITKEAPNYSP